MAGDVALWNFFVFVVISYLASVLSHDALDRTVFLPDEGTATFVEAKTTRFLLYDVNPGEGVNLRRDVYMRVANLVKFLNEDEPWTLVLPPWGRLYHWQTPNLHQMKIPWGTFFDLPSLNRHIPVMELTDYFKVFGEAKVEEVYYLQPYVEGWTDGRFEEKMDIRHCMGDPGFFQEKDDDRWYGWFYGYEQMYAEKMECISIQGHAAFMKPFLLHNTTARSVYLENAEQLLHGQYSEFSPEFWTARRSMRYAKHLRQIGDEFREEHLDSTDEKDRTVLAEDWTTVQKQHGEAIGGPYMAVHLRRKDYVRAHAEDVPSLKNAAKQIKAKLKKLKLDKVFIATDAPAKEFEQLKGYLSDVNVYRFVPTDSQLQKYKDGGVTIIDQWIAAHARYFMGTHVSTVTFRIHEDREILGFDPETTFNCLCGDKKPNCDQPTQWKILY